MQSAQSKFQENKFGINFKQKAKKSKVFSYSRIRSLKAASWNHKRKKKKKKIYHAYLSKENISTPIHVCVTYSWRYILIFMSQSLLFSHQPVTVHTS